MVTVPVDTKLTPVVVWGASGHALVVVDILRLSGLYQPVGFLDDIHPQRRGELFDGLPILGGGEQLASLFASGIRHLVIGFGHCEGRLRAANVAGTYGFEFVTAIHPRAVIAANAQIGAGSVVAAGAIVNPLAQIGEHVILNTGASVDHECTIQRGVHLGPGARLAGQVHVGRAAWIGIGAMVREKVQIGQGALIGAGAVVVRNIPEYVVAYGCPARVVRQLVPPQVEV